MESRDGPLSWFNFFHFHVFLENICPGGVCPGGSVCPGEGVCLLDPPVNRITERCENITLLQLRCGR